MGNFEVRRIDESSCRRVNQSESNGSKLSLATLRSNRVKPDEERRNKSFAYVMKKYTEPMMDYCEFFDTEEEAIAACREVNRGLNSKDPACCVVVDGPEDNYAVVDFETAKDLLDFGGESQLPCLIVTD
jgi:hypothetical protein